MAPVSGVGRRKRGGGPRCPGGRGAPGPSGARAATAFRRLFGKPPFDRLARPHALIAAADALFGVSLAGSLFFSVSVDAARPRIVLYLLVTMAPFAIVAPLVGPFVDRLPGGQRILIVLTCVARGIVCLNLAGELRTLAFYPLAFSILVLGKTYSVAKNTVVPRLVDDPEGLVEANSRLSRLATYTGSVAVVVGVSLLNLAGAEWVLRGGSGIYLVAALFALRLPQARRPAPIAPPGVQRRELRAAALRRAASAMGTLRGGVGFLLFLLAIGLKRSGEPTWFFGAVFAAHAAGGFAGTFVAPFARRFLREETLLTSALAVVGAVSLFACVGPGRLAVGAVALVLGTGANAGRQAFDSLVQRDAPDVERGRLFARFETRFQLSWVLGALLAVATEPPLWAGFLIVGVVTVIAALSYRRAEPASGKIPVAGDRARPPQEETGEPAAGRLLRAAESLAARSELDAAVVLAATSVDAAADAGLDRIEPSAELERLRRRILGGATVSPEQARWALAHARSVIGPSGGGPAGR
jgi:hypothetical protein